MLANWCKPPTGRLWAREDLPGTLGEQIEVLTRDSETTGSHRVALFGTDAGADDVRAALYALSDEIGPVAPLDLGNLRKARPDFAVPLLEELFTAGILPVWIGGEQGAAAAMCMAFRKQSRRAALCELHPRAGYGAPHTEWQSPAASPYTSLGGQAHRIPRAHRAALREQPALELSLGQLRTELTSAEPFLRNADLLGIDLGVLSETAFPAAREPGPVGLTVAELCQLAFYGGISDRLKGLSLEGWRADRNWDGRSARVVATVIWYFLDGVQQRKGDFPVSKDHMTEYVLDGETEPRVFWKSERSGRWWVELTDARGPAPQKQLLACSYDDYQRLTKGELSPYLLDLLHRFAQ